MRLHTRMHEQMVHECLEDVKRQGRIPPGVVFTGFTRHQSRSRPCGYEIQLGAYDRELPDGTADQRGAKMKQRKRQNSGTYGADVLYAATWDEWGWFMAKVFARDPDAVFGPYRSRWDFKVKTGGRFDEVLSGMRTGAGSGLESGPLET
jgi:hypothetical protein